MWTAASPDFARKSGDAATASLCAAFDSVPDMFCLHTDFATVLKKRTLGLLAPEEVSARLRSYISKYNRLHRFCKGFIEDEF